MNAKQQVSAVGIGPFLALLLVSFLGADLHAQVKVLGIDPAQTGAGIKMAEGPDVAVYDPSVAPRHKLLLFLVGTKTKANASLPIDKTFAAMGYRAIGLDYDNGVMAVSNAHSRDASSFARYREAIVTGAPVDPNVQVNEANSILNRFQATLAYLALHDPDGGWAEFLDQNQPVWKNIVVAGHSQGAGHAAYIGQMFRVDRVLMFSGPQDYMDELHMPAPWESRKSATPPTLFFAFLHLKDPFNVDHQIANCAALMHLSKPKMEMVQPGGVIQGVHQILVNDFATEQRHGSTMFPQFENVWKYMATVPVE